MKHTLKNIMRASRPLTREEALLALSGSTSVITVERPGKIIQLTHLPVDPYRIIDREALAHLRELNSKGLVQHTHIKVERTRGVVADPG